MSVHDLVEKLEPPDEDVSDRARVVVEEARAHAVNARHLTVEYKVGHSLGDFVKRNHRHRRLERVYLDPRLNRLAVEASLTDGPLVVAVQIAAHRRCNLYHLVASHPRRQRGAGGS